MSYASHRFPAQYSFDRSFLIEFIFTPSSFLLYHGTFSKGLMVSLHPLGKNTRQGRDTISLPLDRAPPGVQISAPL
ncbi:MAG TPA: hypothetical protein VMH27_11660 [Puia sp.]|nr:hypothetical protein [Puia sp.]